jgi:hypothetical protein
VFPQQSAAADLHDKALTAQPPIRKGKSHHHNNNEALLGVLQDIFVIVSLTVAAGILTRAIFHALSSLWSNINRKGQDSQGN